MSAPALITQADAQRLFAAACKAGLPPKRAKLTRAGLELIFDESTPPPADDANPWDADDAEAPPA